MMASRGMGDINPSKMPKGEKKDRRDSTDFTQYKKGGQVWDKPRPTDLGEPKKLSSDRKAKAKAAAKAAGRPYPNLIDNMKAAKGMKK
jgi:hypothetical protein